VAPIFLAGQSDECFETFLCPKEFKADNNYMKGNICELPIVYNSQELIAWCSPLFVVIWKKIM